MAVWLFAVGGLLSVVAGTMSWLITFEEMRHHWSRDRARARREATHTAVVTTAVFVALTGAIALVLPHIFTS